MLNSINIQRGQNGGAYDEMLDVADSVSRKHGSAVNAIAQMIAESPLYIQALAKLNERHAGENGITGSRKKRVAARA